MIAKGRATPVQKTQLFTTVVDEQEVRAPAGGQRQEVCQDGIAD
jgi:hypothetical protein